MQGNDGKFKPERNDNRLRPRTQTMPVILRSREAASRRTTAPAAHPSRLAEPVLGPRFARTRWLPPQDDGSQISVPLPPRLAAAGGFGVIHRAHAPRALPDMHL